MAWFTGYRRLTLRYERRADTFKAFLALAAALVCFKRLALEVTQTVEFVDRPVDEISGGQRQRVWISMAQAQRTDILLLDETTTFLDVNFQIEVLDLVTDLNRSRGTTIVMVLRDLNLAARYSDYLIAKVDGRIHAFGGSAEVLTVDTVERVFGLRCETITAPVSERPLMVAAGVAAPTGGEF